MISQNNLALQNLIEEINTVVMIKTTVFIIATVKIQYL